jgi:hypothetical protein
MTNTIEKIGLRWGAITLLLLSAYFIIMKLLGLIHIPELRVLNAFIMFYGVYQAIKTAKFELDDFNYFKGFGAGALTAFSATFVFSVFGIVYLQFIDPSFLSSIIKNEPLGFFMNEYSASIQIFIEGAASGILFSYASLQWLRTPYLAGGN